jgi:regulator of sigma E protease
MVTDESVPFHKALITAFPITLDKLSAVLESIGGMITNAFRGAPVLKDVVGPVGLVSVVGDAAEHGWGSVLILAGFISLNLTVVNLIPVPALDGGRLVLLGIEGLMRKNAPPLAVRVFNAFGIGLIALLMISVTYQDILRLIG